AWRVSTWAASFLTCNSSSVILWISGVWAPTRADPARTSRPTRASLPCDDMTHLIERGKEAAGSFRRRADAAQGDGVGDGVGPAVRQRQQHAGQAQADGRLADGAGQGDLGPPVGPGPHLDVGPAHVPVPREPQGLEHRLLGGPALGEQLAAALARLAVA